MENIRIKTNGMQGTEVSIPDFENATKQELLNSLKQLFDQEKQERLGSLHMLFLANEYLSPEFILDAIITKTEEGMEGGEIDDHMRGSAEKAMEIMNMLYTSWMD